MKKIKTTLKPSQFVNLHWLILAIISAFFMVGGFETYNYINDVDYAENFVEPTIHWIFIVPIIWWLWKYLVIACWSFYMDEDSETILEKKGVFTVTRVEIQYFRIKSIQIYQPFLLRIFGLSNVRIITSEPFKPYLTLYAISDGEGWAHYCKEMAKYWRKEKGVKETDFHAF